MLPRCRLPVRTFTRCAPVCMHVRTQCERASRSRTSRETCDSARRPRKTISHPTRARTPAHPSPPAARCSSARKPPRPRSRDRARLPCLQTENTIGSTGPAARIVCPACPRRPGAPSRLCAPRYRQQARVQRRYRASRPPPALELPCELRARAMFRRVPCVLSRGYISAGTAAERVHNSS